MDGNMSNPFEISKGHRRSRRRTDNRGTCPPNTKASEIYTKGTDVGPYEVIRTAKRCEVVSPKSGVMTVRTVIGMKCRTCGVERDMYLQSIYYAKKADCCRDCRTVMRHASEYDLKAAFLRMRAVARNKGIDIEPAWSERDRKSFEDFMEFARNNGFLSVGDLFYDIPMAMRTPVCRKDKARGYFKDNIFFEIPNKVVRRNVSRYVAGKLIDNG